MIEQSAVIESPCDVVDTHIVFAAAVLSGGSSVWSARLLTLLTGHSCAAERLHLAGLAQHISDDRYMLVPEAASQAQAILDDDPQGERKIHAAAAAWYAAQFEYQPALE